MSETAAERNTAYYDQESPGREDYWRFMAAPRFRVRRTLNMIKRRRPSTLVDLGCGGGQFLDEVAEAFPDIALTGTPLSARQIRENSVRNPRIEWVQSDLQTPGVFGADVSGRFDGVIAMELIEHLDHPDKMLENALELARPGGGWLFLTTQSGPIRPTEQHVGHVRHFDRAALDALLRRAGWKPVKIWNEGFPFHDAAKWYANRRPDETLEQFGSTRYGTVERAICFGLRLAFRLNSRRRGAQLYGLAERPAG